LGIFASKLTSDSLFQDDDQQEWAENVREIILALGTELKESKEKIANQQIKLNETNNLLKLEKEKLDRLEKSYQLHINDCQFFYECSCGELIEEAEVDFCEDGGIWCPKCKFPSDFRERKMSYHPEQKLIPISDNEGWVY
jgi:hypothetical protein